MPVLILAARTENTSDRDSLCHGMHRIENYTRETESGHVRELGIRLRIPRLVVISPSAWAVRVPDLGGVAGNLLFACTVSIQRHVLEISQAFEKSSASDRRM